MAVCGKSGIFIHCACSFTRYFVNASLPIQKISICCCTMDNPNPRWTSSVPVWLSCRDKWGKTCRPIFTNPVPIILSLYSWILLKLRLNGFDNVTSIRGKFALIVLFISFTSMCLATTLVNGVWKDNKPCMSRSEIHRLWVACCRMPITISVTLACTIARHLPYPTSRGHIE